MKTGRIIDMITNEITSKLTKENCGEKSKFNSTIGLVLTNATEDVKLLRSLTSSEHLTFLPFLGDKPRICIG